MHQQRNDKTISFRLRGRPLAELVRQAEAIGISPGELGRAIVERYLTRDDTRTILDALEGQGHRLKALGETLSHIKDDLSGLRHDFERALRAN